MHGRRTGAIGALAALVLALALAAAAAAPAGAMTLRQLVPWVGGPFAAEQPNIVFVLTDDLSWDLVQHMPNVRQMQREGATFTNYFVTDSLCCPSRASILTGRFPHNTGVYRNTGPDGGFRTFTARGLERTTYATALEAAGYRTALMGKYMNQYAPGRVRTVLGRPYVPPGWSEWAVAGNGYPGYGYRMTTRAGGRTGRRAGRRAGRASRVVRTVRHGYRPRDYLTTVLRRRGLDFVARAAAERTPFMLNLWTFAPHAPFVAAPRDRARFAGLRAPRGPAFDEQDISDKPGWLRSHPRLRPGQVERIDTAFRARVRAVQAVDRMVGRLRAQLRELGVADRTYVVFSSDNGFHLGQHRLTPGKLTAYDEDVRVPLIVTGPDVPAGLTVEQMAENVDLCPTFSELAGAVQPPRVDGRSLVPLLRGERPRDWRDAILVEHRGGVNAPDDPDLPPPGSGNPPTYEALRTRDTLYVEYADGDRELYDLTRDPAQLDNVASTASPERRAALSAALGRLRTCRGLACWDAERLR